MVGGAAGPLSKTENKVELSCQPSGWHFFTGGTGYLPFTFKMLESLEIPRNFEAFSMPGILKMPGKPPIRNLSFCFGLYRESQIKSV